MAADINKVVIVGRLTRDAELSYTTGGFAILKLSMAVNRSVKKGEQWEDEASFFDVTVLGKRGEAISSYMTKGKRVAVDGGLQQDRWESQDGTKRSKVLIIADNVQFLDGKNDSAPAEQKRGSLPDHKDPASPQYKPGPQNFEDDIPF